MTNVAVCTRNFIVIMWAAVPPKTNITAVAIEAPIVLHHDIRLFVRSKFNDRRPLLSASNSGGVLTARPVTGLALQLAVSISLSAAKQKSANTELTSVKRTRKLKDTGRPMHRHVPSWSLSAKNWDQRQARRPARLFQRMS